jgi:hypothetical protein
LDGTNLVFTKALSGRLRALWLVFSIISSIWFLYWICYDLLVWNKALTQVLPANYAGFVVSITFAVFGSQLGKFGIVKTPLLSSEQNIKMVTKSSQVPQNKSLQPIDQLKQSLPKEEEKIKVPQGASVPSACKFYLGYLHTRTESGEIPEECLACERVVQCLSPTAETLSASA